MKTCSSCKSVKPISEFYNDARSTDGLQCSCKRCCNVRSDLWRKRNLQKSRDYARRWEAENPEKIRAYRKAFIERNREHYRKRCRRSTIKRKYGVTEHQFVSMKIAQGGRCAVCGDIPKNKELCIDHNHTTGKVRGLLCNHCNTILGLAEDNAQILANAITYLQRTA